MRHSTYTLMMALLSPRRFHWLVAPAWHEKCVRTWSPLAGLVQTENPNALPDQGASALINAGESCYDDQFFHILTNIFGMQDVEAEPWAAAYNSEKYPLPC